MPCPGQQRRELLQPQGVPGEAQVPQGAQRGAEGAVDEALRGAFVVMAEEHLQGQLAEAVVGEVEVREARVGQRSSQEGRQPGDSRTLSGCW